VYKRGQPHEVVTVGFASQRPAHQKALQNLHAYRASIVSKTRFIVPTDAHYYKIIEMLNNLKLQYLPRHVSVHAGPSSGSSPVLS
jgi:hypothetical protein